MPRIRQDKSAPEAVVFALECPKFTRAQTITQCAVFLAIAVFAVKAVLGAL